MPGTTGAEGRHRGKTLFRRSDRHPIRRPTRTRSRGHRPGQFWGAAHSICPRRRFLCPRRAHRTRAAPSLYRPRRPGCGSAAAPTAGLHFTPEILEQIRGRGIEIAEITLHVGLGTFQPVRVEKVEDHKLHRERYNIPAQAAEAINRARAAKRRVVAVGTTTLRTLEYAAE